ncbi:ankyrin repeat domain-containing protein [Candidatus Bathyarchaeota archaeon]|nr:ankyrin repeat domain-containing protein [Candidatus Bathyarchaeota archaeon]
MALNLVVSRGKSPRLPLDIADTHGQTPLAIAAEAGHASMTRALLQLHRPLNLWRPILSVLFAAVATGNDPVLDVILGHDKMFVNAFGGDSRTARIASINGVNVVSRASWTLLHAAAWGGQYSTAELLLGRSASVNIEAESSLTPLGLVAVIPPDQLRPQHLGIAGLLIDRGADLSRGGLGNTPLHLAALAGHHDMVSFLLSRGALVGLGNWEGQSALHCAVQGGHCLVASKLIENGADVKQLGSGVPLLHRAVLTGRLDMVETLVAAGVDVNIVGPDGTTALLVASSTGPPDIVRYLLANGSILERRTAGEGLSALDAAATNGQLESVKEILDYIESRKFTPSDKTYAWVTAGKCAQSQSKICEYIYERTNCQRDLGAGILHWAVTQDCMPLLSFLIHREVDLKTPSSDGWSALHSAAMTGNMSIARAILDTGFDVNYSGHASRTALHQAVAADQPSAVAFLLSNGADPSVRDENAQLPVHIAIDYGAMAALRALPLTIGDFAVPEFDGKTLVGLASESGDSALLTTLLAIERTLYPGHQGSLQQAVGAGDTQLVRQLLDHGADLEAEDFEGHSPLRNAVKKRNREAVSILVESGADLESRCNLGATPLYWAATHNDLELAKLLISHGADVNSRKFRSQCPILVAAASDGHPDMVDLLIKSGCDIRCRAPNGITALHQATLRGQTETATRLVQAGLPVDLVGDRGQSALIYACRHAQHNTAAALVGLGANANLADADNKTPLHVAAEEGHWPAAEALFRGSAYIDVDVNDNETETPMITAARKGRTEFIRHLMDLRPHLAVPSRQWDIAAAKAAENDHFETVDFFIQRRE